MRSTIALSTTAALAIAATLAFAPLWLAAMLGTGLVAGVLLASQERRKPSGRPASPASPSALVASAHSDVVMLFDTAGVLDEVSMSVREVLGLSERDFASLRLSEFVHEDDREGLLTAYREAVSNADESSTVQVRVRGATQWQRMEIQIGTATTSEGSRILVRLRDVAERSNLEEALDRRSMQLTMSTIVARQALAGSDEGTLVQAAVTATRDALATDTCELYRTAGPAPELTAGIGPGGIQLDRRSTTLQGSALASAASEGAVAFEADGRVITEPTAIPCTAVAVPIESSDGVDGALIARSLTPRTFEEADLAFLHTVAGIVALARRQRGAEQDAFRRSRHDELTGLVNKDVFLERLANSITHCEDDGEMVAVLLLDLDHFKIINDSLGHAAGDAVIEQVSVLLSGALRPGDTLARFGGDEFIVLARRLSSASHAVLAAERLQSVLEQPVTIAGHDVQLTASVGVTTCADAATAAGHMVRAADAALYRAKELGRERVTMFEPEMLHAALTRLETEEELREALASGQLRVLYQPIVDLGDGHTERVEALVRWVHPRRGLVAPDAFIPISESTGLIEEIGAWVVDDVARQAKVWVDAGRPLRVSINLSTRQLGDPALLRVIDDACAAHQINGSLLAVEVTEGAIASDAAAAITTLRQLNDRGIAITIDDFGTGYSSITHLRGLPIDSVKIDRSLVADVGRSGEDYSIVAAMVQLARAIGTHVVAKGVETEEQLDLLRDLGCDLAQGFLFSPAVLEVTHGSTNHPWPGAAAHSAR